MSGFNLAGLGDAERLAVSVDRAACLIRWEIRELKGTERQRVALLLLDKHPADQRELIAQAMRMRSSGRA